MSETRKTPAEAAPAWHSLDAARIADELRSDALRGLGSEEAALRLQREGTNTLEPDDEEPWWEEVLESLREPLQLLLIAVAALYFWLGETGDALTILGVILVVAGIEVTSELRAKRAVAALSSLAAPNATVLRDGQVRAATARELVPGDVVLLAPGDRVPADLRLVDTVALRLDESSLTGESMPVAKDAQAQLAAATELGDRATMAYAGTLVTAGKGRGLVVATGMKTEIGRIAGLVKQAREPRTPLQQALGELSRWLLWVAIGFSVLVPVLGVLVAGQPVREMLLTGLTLAFATIPEELPILITIVLGLGAYRLAQRNAIVKRLKAAETLGSVSVIATDKTGTLTENRMRLAKVLINGHELAPDRAAATAEGRRLLVVATLANDGQSLASANGARFVGDPTDTALLAAADDAGLNVSQTREHFCAIEEFPFSDDRKRMSVLVEEQGRPLLALKGAPESVLELCSAVRHEGVDRPMTEHEREGLQAHAADMAARGLRVLAVAERSDPPITLGAAGAAAIERGLVLLGLAGLEDPPRQEAAAAVHALQRAGVRVLMVTGDHPATARAIAARVGIGAQTEPVRSAQLEGASPERWRRLAQEVAVFARSTPEDKLRIVRALQDAGEVVAVTGDGVNDAPALKEAAIGVAMGGIGTDVARETADLIVADDNFATVTEAVRTGRQLYANLRKAVRYYLAAKVALVSSALAAVLLKLPVPFEPVQIIVMELFMDLGASVTFVAEQAEDDLMSQPPRDPRRPFMDRSMCWGIVAGGLSLGAAVLVGYLGALHAKAGIELAQSAAFVAWMIGHVVLAAHMRAERQPLLRTRPWANRPFLWWAGAVVALLVAAQEIGPLQQRLHFANLPASTLWLAVSASVLLPSWWEVWKWMRRHKG